MDKRDVPGKDGWRGVSGGFYRSTERSGHSVAALVTSGLKMAELLSFNLCIFPNNKLINHGRDNLVKLFKKKTFSVLTPECPAINQL